MRFVVALATLATIIVIGCNTTDPTPTTVPTPTTPPVQPTRQGSVTNDGIGQFTRFTNAAKTFSISYPDDWELLLSQMEAMDESLRELMEDSPATARILFFAAELEDGIIQHSARVTLDALQRELTVDQYAEGVLRLFKDQFPEVSTVSRSIVPIGNHSGHLVEMEGDLASFGGEGRFRNLILMTTSPGLAAGWNVTCSMLLPVEDSIASACERIVGEFVLLP